MSSPGKIRVALTGCGAWGQNLMKTLAALPSAELCAVVDSNAEQLARVPAHAPLARLFTRMEDALALPLDAMLIATPAHTHAALVMQALSAGLDVFVEKPMAHSLAWAERCALKAEELGRIGMVGHLLRYHPTVLRLLAHARSGRLGAPRVFEASRKGSVSDRASTILWSLGPHDLSVLSALDPSPVISIDAKWIEEGTHVRMELGLASGLLARIELSRFGAEKERKMAIFGDLRSAHFDDVRAPEKLSFFSRASGAEEGEEHCEHGQRPLHAELSHFLDCVKSRRKALSSFAEGVAVVRLITRVEAACRPLLRAHSESEAPKLGTA